ncbi:peptidase [Desulfitobacterium metallireducens]|uniref:N(6)-L-threonylcarbamoyladenine synthase n=1 Tax=Desulfitobacterium metallireducens DSM 15288 TaxID=871968 RepID=W0E9F6_9FIRM|nr:peptidase [Desulfitobacterium metallireducens]AHF07397.1 peptidase [Desulfitobacterium metallireducens DSM 15288]
MPYYLGVDTSAYTTSLAVVDEKALLHWEDRKVLNVPTGERGLAQSEAFFQHVQNLPHLVEKIPTDLWSDLAGVGVSMAPRPVEGSYMPVFTAGYCVASSLATGLRLPLYLTSHQEGHLAAGIVSGRLTETQFLAVHLSGGTTELLRVEKKDPGKIEIELLGGTTDLHAGQFVDRIGVRLGLSFPAGKELEHLAQGADSEAASLLPSAVRGFEVSFSGVESAAQRLIDQHTPSAQVARAVEGCVARTMGKLILAGIEKTGIKHCLIVGGVASNQFIRAELARRLVRKTQLYWAEPEWSRDQAIGVALLTSQGMNSKPRI